MVGQLEDRVAVITGAGEGIGRGIANAFVKEGAKVVIAELNQNLGAAAEDDLGADAFFVHTDVSIKEDNERMIAAAIKKWGTVDILVNNAWGGGEISRVESKSPELLAHGLNVGFLGPLWAMIAAHPVMKNNGYGRIVNLCSLNGVNAHMGTVEYNSAKEALRSATRTVAREWAPLGITANIICPAAKSASFFRVMKQFPELIAAADTANPMGRMGDCEEDIGPVAVFLASEGSGYVTGNTLFADGGSHINGSSWAPDLGE
ncbi:MAG: SDR family NAD(P)-dependent oxidoreductase [Acidimicrobiales bacterium]|nr:SDR family oxidoreductase [Acidimicrobiales bacterium]MDG1846195.1 SDR family NAD(P)-dependent oxidoreductase [Acidimicrobiales bacterium]